MSTDLSNKELGSQLAEAIDQWILKHFPEVAKQDDSVHSPGMTEQERQQLDDQWDDEEKAEGAYSTELQKAEERLATLSGKPGIDDRRRALENTISQAKGRRGNDDFTGAVTLLQDTVSMHAAAEKAASDYEKYHLEHVKAAKRVNDLTPGKDGIPTQFAEIENEFKAAETEFKALKYDLANDHLAKVLSLHPTADQAVIDYAKYNVEHVKAAKRVNDLTPGKDGIPTQFAEIENEFKAAESDFTQGKYDTANTHLAQVLALHPGVEIEAAAYANYMKHHATTKKRVTDLEAHPGRKGKANVWFGEIDSKLKEAERLHGESKHVDAFNKLKAAYHHRRDDAEKMANACEFYDNNLQAVEDRLTDLNNHGGKDSIVVERGEIQAKLNEAKSQAAAGEYVNATARLTEAWNLHRPFAENEAQSCKNFLDYIVTLRNSDVTPLNGIDGSEAIATEIAAMTQDLIDVAPRIIARQRKVANGVFDSVSLRSARAREMAARNAAYKLDRTAKESAVDTLKLLVKNFARRDVIGAEITALDESLRLAAEQAALAKREYVEAMSLMADIPARCAAATEIANGCMAYESALVTATEAINKIKDNPLVATESEAVAKLMNQAAGLATNESRKFAEAKALLEQAILAAGKAASLATDHAQGATATDLALKQGGLQEAITALKQEVQKLRELLPQIDTLTAHLGLSQRLNDIDKSLAEIPLDSKEAPAVLLKAPAEACVAAGLELRRLISFDFPNARKAAAETIAQLEPRCKDTPLAAKLAEVKTTTLEAADTQAAAQEFVAALGLLAKTAPACEQLKSVADKMDTYNADQPGLESQVNGLEPQRTHIGAEIDAMKETLRLAKLDADAGKFTEAIEKLEELRKAIAVATALAEVKKKIAANTADKTAIEALLNQPGGAAKLDALVASLPDKQRRDVMMAAVMARFDIDEFKQFRTDSIWECPWQPCTGRNYEQDSVCHLCGGRKDYWICDDSTCGQVNDWNDSNCSACNGTTGLSYATEVNSSYDTTGLQESDYTGRNKSFKKIYQLLQQVPDSHTKDNPSLKKIIFYREDTGGAAYGGGQVLLNCGRAGGSSLDYATQLLPGSPKHQEFFPAADPLLPDTDPGKTCHVMDPNCLPKDDSVTPGHEKPYFNWATLHEIGHAVDDKQGFMKQHGSKSDFGGWIEYGGDVTKIAEAANNHFQFDRPYIEEKLIGNTPSLPPIPTDSRNLTGTQWNDLKTKVDQWCDGIRVSNSLWWDGANSVKLSIGGRVYQEAYDGSWVSYELAARNRGIHGYQFRAPAEWFAELYAAYHSGVLKDQHPSASWLGKL